MVPSGLIIYESVMAESFLEPGSEPKSLLSIDMQHQYENYIPLHCNFENSVQLPLEPMYTVW